MFTNLASIDREREWCDTSQHPQGLLDKAGVAIYCIVFLPDTFGGPWVLPRLEDRGQPPFLYQFEAGNVGGSREGSRFPPLEPHAGLQGLHSYSAAITHRLRPVAVVVGFRRDASVDVAVALLPTSISHRYATIARCQM